jgi:hypothetical protein
MSHANHGVCNISDFQSTPRAKQKKFSTPRSAPLYEEEVRRSPRLKSLNKGFKPKSYDDRYCFGCNVSPPTLSARVISNLGATLSKISCDKLSNEGLSKKKEAINSSMQPTV